MHLYILTTGQLSICNGSNNSSKCSRRSAIHHLLIRRRYRRSTAVASRRWTTAQENDLPFKNTRKFKENSQEIPESKWSKDYNETKYFLVLRMNINIDKYPRPSRYPNSLGLLQSTVTCTVQMVLATKYRHRLRDRLNLIQGIQDTARRLQETTRTRHLCQILVATLASLTINMLISTTIVSLRRNKPSHRVNSNSLRVGFTTTNSHSMACRNEVIKGFHHTLTKGKLVFTSNSRAFRSIGKSRHDLGNPDRRRVLRHRLDILGDIARVGKRGDRVS